MSSGTLPQFVDPFRLADAQGRVTGVLPAGRCERIREFSLGSIRDVDVDLSFSRDRDKLARIEGHVATTITVACERCLKPLELALAADVDLVAIAPGQTVPESAGEVDTVDVEESRLLLAPMVEDELLLALPPFPTHENCDMVDYDRGPAAQEPAEKKASPFAALAGLKRKD